MKAKDFNGSISTWRRLPKTYKSATKYYTAFDKASKDIIEAEGFYDVVMRYEGSEVNVIYFSI